MKRVLNFIIAPFTINLHHFISLSILVTTFDILFYLKKGFVLYAIYIGAHEILIAYLFTLFVSIPNNLYIKRILLFFVYFIALAYFLLGAFASIVMKTMLHEDFVTAVLDTNISEASEFLSTFISPIVLLIGIGTPSLIAILAFIIKKHEAKPWNKTIRIIGAGTIACCIILFVHNPMVWKDGIISHLRPLVTYERYPDLTELRTTPILIQRGKRPKNIVIIIGESEMKQRCSIYGYKKETTPRLKKLEDDGLLFAFSNVSSPSTNTANTFKYLLNTSRPGHEELCNWYESTTIFDVLHQCGYKSYWLSNQSKHGMFDNLVGKFSELSDTAVFIGNKFGGMARNNNSYDEKLIPIVKDFQQRDDSLCLFIVHLMGNHELFKYRYPQNFDIFKPEDYLEFPENQRETRAEYDNSILYNDYVVSEIMKVFSKSEAIVFYFPDHGLDVYETDPSYSGHARPEPKSKEVATAIPFLVYTSPIYKERFPQMMETILLSRGRIYRTDNLIYTIMNVMGTSFKDNHDVANMSLFR